MDPLNLRVFLFYLGYSFAELAIAVLSLLIPLVLLTMGSSLSEMPKHANNLENLRDYLNWTVFVTFLIGTINMAFSSCRKKIGNLIMLAMNVSGLLGYVIYIGLAVTKSDEILHYIWSGIKDEDTIRLLEDYFFCCGTKTCHSNLTTCVNIMKRPLITNQGGGLGINPLVAALCIITIFCVCIQILTIVILHWIYRENGSQKSTNNEPAKFSKPPMENVAVGQEGGKGCKVRIVHIYVNKIRAQITFGKFQLEKSFGFLGEIIAINPKQCICLVMLFGVTCTLGLLQYFKTPYTLDIFVPATSELGRNSRMADETFNLSQERVQSLIVSSDNVLQQAVIQSVYEMDSRIKSIAADDGQTFKDLCVKINGKCKQRSILELWQFEEDTIKHLTQEDILTSIDRTPLISPVFRLEMKRDTIVADTLKRNSSLIGGKFLFLSYVTKGTTGAWEERFVEIAVNSSNEVMKVYANAQQSQEKEQNTTYNTEFYYLGYGALLMFIYTFSAMGKYSLIKHRLWLTLTSILNIGMAIGTGVGVGVALGKMTGMLTNLIPFLILGIGIDDMFIIFETWDKNSSNGETLDVKLIAKRAMKKAGIAILVTTLTDSIVFLCGSVSEMKMFRDFNIMCSIALITLFIYQVVHWVFDNVLSKYILKLPVKIIVISISVASVCTMVYFTTKLKVHVENRFYFSASSYVHDYLKTFKSIPMETGISSSIYIVGDNLYNEMDNIEILHDKLAENPHVQNGSVSSLFTHMRSSQLGNFTMKQPITNFAIITKLPSLSIFSQDLSLRNDSVRGFRIHFNHIVARYSYEKEEAITSITKTCESIPWKNATAFPFTMSYIPFYSAGFAFTNFKRSLIVVVVCVAVIVYLTVLSFQLTFFIAMNVLMTLISVSGCLSAMEFSIEIITTLGFLLSVGLAVDFSVHMGHFYLLQPGTREQRAKTALREIGPAIFHGGFSTLLVVVFLWLSKTYSYYTFCAEISFVISFGLWNGLILLPVILSLIGPEQLILGQESDRKREAELELSNVIKNDHFATERAIEPNKSE